MRIWRVCDLGLHLNLFAASFLYAVTSWNRVHGSTIGSLFSRAEVMRFRLGRPRLILLVSPMNQRSRHVFGFLACLQSEVDGDQLDYRISFH